MFSFFNSLLEDINDLRSKALRTVVNNLLRSGGFGIKSYAPFLIASTAKSTSPCPVIITIVRSGLYSIASDKTSIPSFNGIFISLIIKSYSFSFIFSSPTAPFSASSTFHFGFSSIKMLFKTLRIACSSSINKIFDIV